MGEKIIRINMTNLTTAIEGVPADLAALGGRALTSTVIAKEVPPHKRAPGQIQQIGICSRSLDRNRGC
jgi:aldehyde:ferredoxin oxidoreductase